MCRSIPEPRLPLQLVRCDRTRDPAGCGLLQLRHTVPGDLLYSSYWYPIFPGVVILVAVLALNTLADSLQKVLDPAQS